MEFSPTHVGHWYPTYVKVAGYAVLASATLCLYAIVLLGVLAYRLSRGRRNDVKAPLQRTLLTSAIVSLAGGLVAASWAARWQAADLLRMLLGSQLEDPLVESAWTSVRFLVILAFATFAASLLSRIAWLRFWNRRVLRLLSVLIGVGLLGGASGFAQADAEDPWVPVGFVILRSTTDYSEAKRVAEQAAARLEIPLDLRGLVFDPRYGLTWPKEICAKDESRPYPCYVARGRYDAGVYISIERSEPYASFARGFFLVVAATGVPGSPELAKALEDARIEYGDAMLRQEKVYFGCMH